MTTNTEEKVGEPKGVDPAILDPEEADRFAALIKPAWEEEDGSVSATSTATPATTTRPSDEGRPTAIDPIPNVDVGDTLPIDNPPIIDAGALVASVEATPGSKGAPPAASARPGSTRMGLGNDAEVAAAVAAAAAGEKSVGATQLGIGNAGALAAAGAAEAGAAAEPDEDLIATQARPVASVPPPPVTTSSPPQPPRPAAGAAPQRASAPARLSDDDPIELPMNRAGGGKLGMGVGIGIGLGIAAIAGLAIFLVKGSGDEAKSAPPAAATTAAAKPEEKAPEIKPPPLVADEAAPKEPEKVEPEKAEPEKPEPEKEPAKADPPKSDAPKTPAGGAKPPAGGTKPPAPPAGGGKPKGGIIRDAPF